MAHGPHGIEHGVHGMGHGLYGLHGMAHGPHGMEHGVHGIGMTLVIGKNSQSIPWSWSRSHDQMI